jgi:arylsulfatase A-like enzyme
MKKGALSSIWLWLLQKPNKQDCRYTMHMVLYFIHIRVKPPQIEVLNMNAEVFSKKLFSFIILIACALSGCHSNANKPIDLLEQSPFWLNWEGNQTNYATPANIWRGFIAKKDNLVAVDENPTIAFFLKKPAPRELVNIVYSCDVPGRIHVFVNEESAVILPASPKLSRYSFSCTQLQKGFNKIHFLADKSFQLRAVYLQKNGARFANQALRELKETEKFEIYLLPGRIDFEFQGQASLNARTFGIVDDRELSAPISRTLSVSEKKTAYSYTSRTPFVASIQCLKGAVTISHLWYSADKTQKKEAQSLETTRLIDQKKIKDIFVFLLDGCQASHLKLYGYNRNTAPRISEFAEDSLVFKHAFSNASYTPAAVGSIFTGLYPDHHQVFGLLDILNKDIITLPRFLKRSGYKTAVFTANAHVSNRSGFVRGVDHYRQLLEDFRFGKSHKMVDAFADWVQATPTPSFSYLHFMEPHFPIVPPPPFLNQYKKIIRLKKDLVIRQISQNERSYSPEEVQDVIDDYDSCINYVDSLFGQAIDTLKKIKRYDNSLIILLSDHGEDCYEHGAWGHGYNAYLETTHVPLVIKFPESCRLKGEIGSLVQTGAIFPTLYKILTGQDGPFDFLSITSILNNRQPQSGGMIVTQGFKENQIYAVAWNQWYYINSIKQNWENLYDMGNEPSRSRIQSQPDLASYLHLRFLRRLRLIQAKASSETKADPRSLSKEEMDHFKAFGYL